MHKHSSSLGGETSQRKFSTTGLQMLPCCRTSKVGSLCAAHIPKPHLPRVCSFLPKNDLLLTQAVSRVPGRRRGGIRGVEERRRYNVVVSSAGPEPAENGKRGGSGGGGEVTGARSTAAAAGAVVAAGVWGLEAVGADQAVVCLTGLGVVTSVAASFRQQPSPPLASPTLQLQREEEVEESLGVLGELFSEDKGGSEGLKWALLMWLTAVPYLNWGAWMLASLDAPEAELRYLLTALVYLVPYLRSGLAVDPLILATLVGGCLHIMLERNLMLSSQTKAPSAPSTSSGTKTNAIVNIIAPVAPPDRKSIKQLSSAASEVVSSVGETSSRALTAAKESLQTNLTQADPRGAEDAVRPLDRAVDLTAEVLVESRRLRARLQERLMEAEVEDAAVEAERERARELRDLKEELGEWDRRFDLRRKTRPELITLAKQLGIRGYSRLRKAELVDMLEEYYDNQEVDPS